MAEIENIEAYEAYNKHYIRVDKENRIIRGFSDATEQPKEGDICINQKGGRCFEMLGMVNPNLLDIYGMYLYEYIDGVIRARPEEAKKADKAKIVYPPSLEDRVKRLEDAVFKNAGK